MGHPAVSRLDTLPGTDAERRAAELKILVVEDDPIDRIMIRRALAEGGIKATITEAATMQAGLEALAGASFDCAILDYGLPDGTARNLMKEAAATASETPMIVLTGHADDEAAHALLGSGAQDYLVKGDVSPAALVRAIRYAMDRHTMQRRLLAAETELARLSIIDPLTDLSNRRGLERRLAIAAAHAQRTGVSTVAILIDCDDFKRINEGFGYAAGDEVLKAVARAITTSVRPLDHGARVGGDEFVILMAEVGLAEAASVADRIRRAVSSTILHWGGEQIPFSVSAGVAAIPTDITNVSQLLAIAQAGLRRSKHAGKNRVSLDDDAWDGPTAEIALAGVLQDGSDIQVGRVPLVDLATQEVIGEEFVTRGPPGPYEMPRDFFGAALELGFLVAADLRCLEGALRSAQRTTAEVVNFNMFPATLLEAAPRLRELIPSNLAKRIIFDLSVQWMTGDPTALLAPVAMLREIGVRFALDDVGFGRSSLEPLILLQPELIKLDGRAVGSLVDAGHRRSLKRLLAVARALDARVVAEGVGTLEEARELRVLGVHYGQGPAFGKMTAEPRT